MGMTNETKKAILDACDQAIALSPKQFPPDLPTTKLLGGAPAWYSFEYTAWSIGEYIQQYLSKAPELKQDFEILDKILQVVECVNLRRGRQSFVMAIGFVAARPCAERLSKFASDLDIDGHVVGTLLKMKAPGFRHAVEPLLASKMTWIKNQAKLYISRYP